MLEESKSGVGRKGVMVFTASFGEFGSHVCGGNTSFKSDADNNCHITHSPIRRMVAGAECKREVALRHGAWEDTTVTRHFGPL
jgi:hypothetical protein